LPGTGGSGVRANCVGRKTDDGSQSLIVPPAAAIRPQNASILRNILIMRLFKII
jgi:hypothetical protein